MQMGHWVIGGWFESQANNIRGWTRLSNQNSLVHFDLQVPKLLPIASSLLFFEAEPFTKLTTEQLTQWVATRSKGSPLFQPEYDGVVEQFAMSLDSIEASQTNGSIVLGFRNELGFISVAIPKARIDLSPPWETVFV